MSSFGSNRKFEKLYGECPLLVFCSLSDQVETFDQLCQIRYEPLHITVLTPLHITATVV